MPRGAPTNEATAEFKRKPLIDKQENDQSNSKPCTFFMLFTHEIIIPCFFRKDNFLFHLFFLVLSQNLLFLLSFFL